MLSRFSYFRVSQFPPLQVGAANSCLAFSTPATWCRIFMSRKFMSRIAFQRPQLMMFYQISLATWQSVMAAYCQVYGVIHVTSPAGWLPVHRDQLRAQRSVTSMGKLYLFLPRQWRLWVPMNCFASNCSNIMRRTGLPTTSCHIDDAADVATPCQMTTSPCCEDDDFLYGSDRIGQAMWRKLLVHCWLDHSNSTDVP